MGNGATLLPETCTIVSPWGCRVCVNRALYYCHFNLCCWPDGCWCFWGQSEDEIHLQALFGVSWKWWIWDQPSKCTGHQQRNKQFREGAFHYFSGFFLPFFQLAAQAGQCHLAPLYDTRVLTPNKRVAIIWQQARASASLLLSFSPFCHANLPSPSPHPSLRSGSITTRHISAPHASILPHLSAFFPSSPIYAAELCTASEELAQSRSCQRPLSQFNSADDWIRGFGRALFISINEAEPVT